jgi:hypothetical protein
MTMSDVMDREPIDEVAKRAVAQLRRDAVARPLPELRLRRHRHWMAPALAIATVVVIITGLVAIGTNRNEAVGDPNDSRWILGDLPAGWTATSAVEMSPGDVSAPEFDWSVYATHQMPLGPIVAIAPESFTDLADPDTIRFTSVDGNAAVIGSSRFPGVLWLDIEVEPGHWVGMTGRGVDEASLLQVGAQLAVSAGERPAFKDPIPLGLTGVGNSNLDAVVTARSTYNSPDGQEWWLSVGPASDLSRAIAGMFGATELPQEKMFQLGSLGPSKSVYWERGNLAFRLEAATINAPDDAAMLRAARSARPATDDEWARLVSAELSTPAVAETSIVPDLTGKWTDVQIATKVVKISESIFRLDFPFPDDSASTTTVRFLGRSLDCGGVTALLSGGGGSGLGTVCIVKSSIDPARPMKLRVYGDHGERYIVDFQTLRGVTLAVFHLNGLVSPSADIVYSDGTISPI